MSTPFPHALRGLGVRDQTGAQATRGAWFPSVAWSALTAEAVVPGNLFADDIFTANKRRTKELLSRMIAEGVAPLWGAQGRTETVDDPEMLELMRRNNCFNVYVGFESINPRTLKLFQKKQALDKIERAIERFHAHSIKIHGMFVIGSDEDDLETLDATAALAKSRQLESVQTGKSSGRARRVSSSRR